MGVLLPSPCFPHCFHTAVTFFHLLWAPKLKRQCNAFIFLLCFLGVSQSRAVTAAVLMLKLQCGGVFHEENRARSCLFLSSRVKEIKLLRIIYQISGRARSRACVLWSSLGQIALCREGEQAGCVHRDTPTQPLWGKPLNLPGFRNTDSCILHMLVLRRCEGGGLIKAQVMDCALQRSKVVFLESRRWLPVWGRLMCANCTEGRHSNRL